MINWIQRKRNKKGFTLIELIVVIAILGILAAIAIPRLGGFQKTAKDNAADATASTIHKSIAIWQADNPNSTGPAKNGDEAEVDALIDATGDWTATYDAGGSVQTVTYSDPDGTTKGYFPASGRP